MNDNQITIIIITYKSDQIISNFVKKIPTNIETIIIENSDKNILDFFSYKNLENASLIKIEIENENSIYYYDFYDNTLLITFSNSKNMVHKISLLQAGNSIFEFKIVYINKYQ